MLDTPENDTHTASNQAKKINWGRATPIVYHQSNKIIVGEVERELGLGHIFCRDFAGIPEIISSEPANITNLNH